MKNFRLFETEAEMNGAVIEDCSVSYVVESNKVYTTPESSGEITFKIIALKWDASVGGYIDETITLKAAKGMTWNEFIDSEYNTLNLQYSYGALVFRYDNKSCRLGYSYTHGDYVHIDDIIIPNYEYTCQDIPE